MSARPGWLVIVLVIFCANCGSSTIPSTNPPVVAAHQTAVSSAKNSSTNYSSTLPLAAVLAQAEQINERLRYYGEEIKTTYKPEKQQALFNSVHLVVQPACQEIDAIITREKLTGGEVVKMGQVCRQLDTALMQHELKQIQAALKEFNPALAELQRAAGVVEKKN